MKPRSPAAFLMGMLPLLVAGVGPVMGPSPIDDWERDPLDEAIRRRQREARFGVGRSPPPAPRLPVEEACLHATGRHRLTGCGLALGHAFGRHVFSVDMGHPAAVAEVERRRAAQPGRCVCGRSCEVASAVDRATVGWKGARRLTRRERQAQKARGR